MSDDIKTLNRLMILLFLVGVLGIGLAYLVQGGEIVFAIIVGVSWGTVINATIYRIYYRI